MSQLHNEVVKTGFIPRREETTTIELLPTWMEEANRQAD